MKEASMANTIKITARGRVPVLELYGEIGKGDLTVPAFSRAWRGLGNPAEAELRISSPGGDCFAGAAIFDLITGGSTRVTTVVDGIAASMASYLFMAGHRRIIGAGAQLMLHNPSAFVDGGAADLQRGAGLLDSIKKRMASVYSKRSGKPLATVLAWMEAETWFDASAAVSAGLADDIGADLKMAASAGFDLSALGYKNVPPLSAPRSMNELAQRFWAAKGKGDIAASPEDVSDLIPEPITQAKAFANFHGKHHGRR